MIDLSIAELSAKVRSGEVRPTEVLEEYFRRIEEREPSVHAFLGLMKERAFARAKAMESGGSEARSGRLAGVPVVIKDNMLVEGEPVACGSKILDGYNATYTSTVVRRIEVEGALIVGRSNMDEFAMGSSTENSAFGPTRNPWNLDCVPGGSSGGSAAAVASGMAPAALGSDTGGSIRQPASFCGITGLKPSYGAVSRYGLVAFASSLDQIGPMTRHASDAAVLFDVIAGHDPRDSTSPAEGVVSRRELPDNLQGLTVGLPMEYINMPGLSPDVSVAVEAAISVFRKEGAKVETISLPHTRFALPAYYIIAPSEASANLARFDGVRYGARKGGRDGSRASQREGDLVALYKRSRTEGFGVEVQRRILVGTFALSHGYCEAYYGRAQQARVLVSDDFDAAFRKVEILLAPTAPTTAFKIGEKTQDPVAMYLSDVFTIPVNLSGIPALSTPCGFSSSGLPVGLQVIGPRGSDRILLRIGELFERATSKQHIKHPSPHPHP